jgi:RNA polymerase sigma-70 factor, ECF subfamily
MPGPTLLACRAGPTAGPPTTDRPLPSNSRVTDEELLALARRGDTDAFGELVARHHATVYRTAFIVCRNREDADDAAQEALIQAWRKLGSFKGHAQFRTWLLTITWRQALSRRRSVWARLQRLASREVVDRSEPVSLDASIERRLAGSELVDRLRPLVDRLPDRLRQPLLLAAAGDCTFEEMATLLRVPSGTLKWRVSEARRRLKRDLAGQGIECL